MVRSSEESTTGQLEDVSEITPEAAEVLIFLAERGVSAKVSILADGNQAAAMSLLASAAGVPDGVDQKEGELTLAAGTRVARVVHDKIAQSGGLGKGLNEQLGRLSSAVKEAVNTLFDALTSSGSTFTRKLK